LNLFTKPQSIQLIRNSQPGEIGKDHFPVSKIYLPKTGYSWLFTEIDMNNPYRFYGLSVHEIGDVKVGYTEYSEFTSLLNDDYETVIRDSYFVAKYPLSVYISAARALGFMTEVEPILERHHRLLNRPGPS
jgi:hypothetical protein